MQATKLATSLGDSVEPVLTLDIDSYNPSTFLGDTGLDLSSFP